MSFSFSCHSEELSSDDDAAVGATGGTTTASGSGTGASASGGATGTGASSSSGGVSGTGNFAGSGAAAGELGDGGTSNTGPHFPCDVEDVIQAKCQRCHTEPPQNLAPFPLLVWEDTRREHGLQLVYEAMLPAIETDFMPFTQLELDPPVEALSPEEKALLLAWLRDEAPAIFDANCD